MAIACEREGCPDVWWPQWLWPKLLRLARAHGWEPMGTSQLADRQQDYPGGWDPQNYTSNDCQIVSAEDARALGDALAMALPNLSEDDELAAYRRPDGGIEIAPNAPVVPDTAWFSGPESKRRIGEFIEYCQAGGFRIT